MCVVLIEGYLRTSNRSSSKSSSKSKYNISAINEKVSFGLFLLLFLDTADLRSYCGGNRSVLDFDI